MRYQCLLWLSVLLIACSTALAQTEGREISPHELLTGTALGLGQNPPVYNKGDEVMALSNEMREFLKENVGKRAGDPVKLRQLSDAVFSEQTFGLEYGEATRTAAETFRARQGNCLSFTFMFVVLARGVGLDARFQEVEIPSEWTFAKSTYILHRHINIHIDLHTGVLPRKVVDFNIADLRIDYDMNIISDNRALAHFFNNMGAELLQRGEMAAAFYAFRKAISEYDRTFSPAWDSLGTLYSREGLSHHAEAAYLHALKIDKSDLTAMNNLTYLYDRRGDPKQAARYRNKVDSHRKRNPYYRFQLARAAYHLEDYDLAIDHLKYAMRTHKDEDRFCALLGMAYLKIGEEKKSMRWMAKAEELAENDSLKSIYSSKIERLKSASH